MNDEQQRAFLAVVLSGFILFGWQYYFGVNPQRTAAPNTVQSQPSLAKPAASIPEVKKVAPAIEKTQLHTLFLSNSFDVDSNLKFYPKNGLDQVVGKTDTPFLWLSSDQEWGNFKYSRDNESETFTADGVTVKFWKEEEKLNFHITGRNVGKLKFNFYSEKETTEDHRSREFLTYGKEANRYVVGDEENEEGTLKWFGLDFKYRVLFFVLDEKQHSTIKLDSNGNIKLAFTSSLQELKGQIIYSKKNYNLLESYGNNLHQSVDFGFFAIVAVPILKGLQLFYSLIPNYGVAIIFLTLLVRLITFPLQYKSFKSMKKMQVLQPQIQKIRDKFKDDPQKMQRETMGLFKKEGANPLGGCFPLLLQMPVFFAFYKVLYEAIELVGAPFYGWIHDLSEKDPYYVLPLLMAVAMFLQQKMTPTTTADPAQKKVMMFMPVIFGFIMKDLPAGLTLYIFVSTVCGIAQQSLVNKVT